MTATQKKLNELGFLGRGKSRHRPRNDPTLYGGKYPFFQTGDVTAAELYLNEFSQTYNDKGLAQSKMWPAGTLCITIAANIAETAILKIPGCFPDSIVGFIPAPEKADVRYIKYYIDTIKRRMQSASRGTTQDNLSLDKLTTFDFDAPPVSEQRRIASILSAYDDLIENNTRRIAILEEMARRIYEEWFVHFRFPGHEQVKRVESELGLIPEGWRVARIGDAFNTVLGGTPSRSKAEYWENGSVPWINSGKVNELRIHEPSEFITELGLRKSATKLMPVGTTVLAITGATLGQVSILSTEMCANQSVVGVTDPTGVHSEYIYRTIKYRIKEVIQHASGGAQQHINKEVVNEVQIFLPDHDVLSQFNDSIVPVGRLISVLLTKNITLRNTRDLLLPKLISGELDVSNLPMPDTH